MDVPLSAYVAALGLHIGEAVGKGVEARVAQSAPAFTQEVTVLVLRRPAAGKSPDPDFDRHLWEERNALYNSGETAPAKVLAARYGINHQTMKGWLARASTRLSESKEER